MRWILSCVVAVGCLASVANAQIIYEPVQYQYGGQNPYYYGGSDPRVHDSALHPWAPGTTWGRGNGFAFRSSNLHTHRAVVTERPRTFTDALPFQNAWVYGFTANDARNEAYARQPRYFRKADLIQAARPDDSGRGLVVPAHWAELPPAGTILIRPTSRHALEHRGVRPVLIIPKDLLERGDDGDSTMRDPLLTRAD